ncbi:hypothetical protein RB594_005464 [Gaeumannomyces avenae]
MSSHDHAHLAASLEAASQGLPTTKVGVWVLGLVTTLVVYGVGLAVYRLWFHPLSKVPGPWYMAISALFASYQNEIKGEFAVKARSLHEKYGDIVRIGPDCVMVDGKVGFADVLARRAGGDATEFRKWPGSAGPGGHLGILGAPNFDTHRRQRRMLSHAFSAAALKEQEDLIFYYIDLFINRVSEISAGGKPLDLVEWLNFATFDIIGDLALGKSFGTLELSKSHYWIKNVFTTFAGVTRLRFLETISSLLVPIGFLLDTDGSIKGLFENKKYSADKAKARMQLGVERPNTGNPKYNVDGKPIATISRDFVTYMLGKKEGAQERLTDEEIFENANTLIVAGSETTATNLSSVFYLLAHPENRHVLKNITDEVRSKFQKETDITFQTVDSKALPYVHACIEEALRIHPPVAVPMPRRSPGAIVAGKYIPEGTKVHVMQYATYHNPDSFVDPGRYHPERFLQPGHPLYDARFKSDDIQAFQPFNHGPRDCIGKNLAYVEMRVIVARILLRFDIELTPETPLNWLEDQRAFIVWKKSPMMVKLTERKGIELKA